MTNIEANVHSLTISDSNISTLIVNQASDHQASQMQRTPRSVCNVGQPVPGFSTTTMFQTVRGFAQHCQSNQPHKNIIIHCHGFPGTGKSQIMRKLAQEFPFSQEPVPMTVKWHIECFDQNQSIKRMLKELVETVAPSDPAFQEIMFGLDQNRAGSFVKFLVQLEMQVLIVIEDATQSYVGQEDLVLLRDFKSSLANYAEHITNPVHLYIATRGALGQNRDYCGEGAIYMDFEITGFTKEEALKYLFSDFNQERSDTAATAVFNRFSGSPLGLRTAKAFCRYNRISYTEYLEFLEEGVLTVQDEISALTMEYGESVQHTFQAITLPFLPRSETDVRDVQDWKVLVCISYLHFITVPRFVVERLCQYFRTTPIRKEHAKNKLDAGALIQRLRSNDLCSDGDDMTFHEVVLHAFRVATHPPWIGDFDPLSCVVDVIASVSSKDTRGKVYYNQTMKLVPHLPVLLKHVESSEIQGDLMFKMLLSHIYDVFGAVGCTKSLGYKADCDRSLQKAFNIIYEVVRGQRIPFMDFVRSHEALPTTETAEMLAALCNEAGRRLDQGFIDEYLTKVLVLRPDEKDFQFLKTTCIPEKGEVFSNIKQTLENNLSTTTEILLKLRECGVFLSEVDLRKIFFAERLISIFHSSSRIVVDMDGASVEFHERRLWMSGLAYKLSMACRRIFGVGVLFEHVSRVGGAVPIILLLSKLVEPEAQIRHLSHAKRICEKAVVRNESLEYPLYENGLVRETKGSVYNLLNIKRHLVRIHTKIVRGITAERNEEYIEEGRRACEDIYQVSIANLDVMAAFKCIVYCGKFYAAIGEHQAAIQCYDKYFEAVEQSGSPPPYSVWSWAVCNYALSVYKGEMAGLYTRALQLCEEVSASMEGVTSEIRLQIEDLVRDLRIRCESV